MATVPTPDSLRRRGTQTICGLLLVAGVMLVVSSGVHRELSAAPQAASPDGKKPSVRRPTKLQEAAIKEAGEARAEIVRKLQAGQYVEFMHQHSPIDPYVRNLREGRAGRVELQQVLGFANLAAQLDALKDAEIHVDATGLVATFTKAQEIEAPPAPKGPYTEPAAATEGYGKDVMAVIKAAHADLKGERYDVFTGRMFPPSTISMMKKDGRWDALQASLSPESPLVEKMLEDLALLTDQQPKIKDGTAEFELPNHVTFRNRQGGEDEELGTRKIRFSLIGGSWRFYDSTAKVSTELDAALVREPAGESASALLVLEKIGSDWRIRQMAGMPK